MNALAFDTHKAVKALKEAGADERLAEAVVATVGDAMGENVATKADIAAVRSDVTGVRSDIATDIAACAVRNHRRTVRYRCRDCRRTVRNRRIGSPTLPPPLDHGRRHCRSHGRASETDHMTSYFL